jgi:hypothetical protein
MSTSILTRAHAPAAQPNERGHRRLLTLCASVAVAGVAAMLFYGFDYYTTAPVARPFNPKHALLRSAGPVGISLGFFGVFLFFLIFLYPLRKRWRWLGSLGNSRHWFNFHILLGITAPVVIAFHASFKFSDLAGMAYWIMFAVAASGIIGRYIYAQVPRRRNSTEISLQELKQLQETLTAKLGAQRAVRPADLASLFRLPDARQIGRESALSALCGLLWIDIKRPLRVARVRRRSLRFPGKVLTLAGLLSSRNRELERTIAVAREQARLSKKLLFLAKSQQILHLWHVVHRPFSYSFAVLALTHIAIALLFGFR